MKIRYVCWYNCMQEKFELLLGYYYCNFRNSQLLSERRWQWTTEQRTNWTTDQPTEMVVLRFRENLMAIAYPIRRLNLTLRWWRNGYICNLIKWLQGGGLSLLLLPSLVSGEIVRFVINTLNTVRVNVWIKAKVRQLREWFASRCTLTRSLVLCIDKLSMGDNGQKAILNSICCVCAACWETVCAHIVPNCSMYL